MNKIRHISTDMDCVFFVRKNARKYTMNGVRYARLQMAYKSLGWIERHFDCYQGEIEPKTDTSLQRYPMKYA